MNEAIDVLAFRHLTDPAVAWSLGSFGAIAEFMWQADEPTTFAQGDDFARITPRGAIRFACLRAATAVAYMTPSRHPERRSAGIALCLPAEQSRMAVRSVVTELGPDVDALRIEDRDSILFDVGLGLMQTDAMVRTEDPETIETLRGAIGRSPFDPSQTFMMAMPRLSPHRVFASRLGRIEVYQPIPAADGRSPDGPHTHVLPKLLKAGRTHAANIPIPQGLVPCLSIHLQKPDRDHVSRDLGLPTEIPHTKETEHDH